MTQGMIRVRHVKKPFYSWYLHLSGTPLYCVWTCVCLCVCSERARAPSGKRKLRGALGRNTQGTLMVFVFFGDSSLPLASLRNGERRSLVPMFWGHKLRPIWGISPCGGSRGPLQRIWPACAAATLVNRQLRRIQRSRSCLGWTTC